MDVVKIKHKTAVIIVGILAVATCPWILTNDSSAHGLDVFVKIYSAFFAPIFGVLLVDYFILHKHNYTPEQLEDLYDDNGDHRGWNWAAIISIAVGAVIGLLNIDIAFFTATIPTGSKPQ
jgi:NCS1 family nucleobase:cation symporter-1